MGVHPLFNLAKEFARMKKADFNPPEKTFEIDINKPVDFKPGGSFWHKPSLALWG